LKVEMACELSICRGELTDEVSFLVSWMAELAV
jgi:hypothetical protein